MSANATDANAVGPLRGGSGAMFDGIAARYDLLNRIISLGIDRRWRRRMVKSLELEPGARVLDVATGTADVAIEAAQSLRRLASDDTEGGRRDGSVVGIDPSENMLSIGRKKLAERKLKEVTLESGSGEALPFSDASFDAVTVAFGIRNIPDRALALREMRRVTRAGGRVAILELSEPEGGLMSGLAKFHVHTVVPAVGALLSGRSEYRYLQRSIEAFPRAEVFAQMMAEAGFEAVEAQALTFGACHLFVGTVP